MRRTPLPVTVHTVTARSPTLPTENEWYKAAYYNGTISTYSQYPDGRNDITHADANYSDPGQQGKGMLVNVNYGTPSSYGVYGMGGNCYQWNDVVAFGSDRGLRGGHFGTLASNIASSYSNTYVVPSNESSGFGFRVASLVPEPSSVALAIFGSGMLLMRRKR